MAENALSISAPGAHLIPSPPFGASQRRQLLETAVERLLVTVESLLADLDALDGDSDLEPEPRELDADYEPSMP